MLVDVSWFYLGIGTMTHTHRQRSWHHFAIVRLRGAHCGAYICSVVGKLIHLWWGRTAITGTPSVPDTTNIYYDSLSSTFFDPHEPPGIAIFSPPCIFFPPRCGREVRHPQSIVRNCTIGSRCCLPACTRLEMGYCIGICWPSQASCSWWLDVIGILSKQWLIMYVPASIDCTIIHQCTHLIPLIKASKMTKSHLFINLVI